MITIDYVNGKYLNFDIDTLKLLREEHRICGTLIGTLPQISQQNIFLGLPQQLVPEEVTWLVRNDHARVVDAKTRRIGLSDSERLGYESWKASEQCKVTKSNHDASYAKRKAALEKRGLLEFLDTSNVSESSITIIPTTTPDLFPDDGREVEVIVEPARYDVFEKLHELGYFLTPGLRFGAQFVAYPGDPLRFHSHFLVIGHTWTEEFPVMDIVSGGRLGTGVKKAWLVGGRDEEGEVKCFTVEWAGM